MFSDNDRAMLAEILQLLKARPASAPATTGAIAPDSDLDGQWGDPDVRKDPPRWNGPSYAGRRYSQCPPEYLDVLASLFDWKAGKDDEKGTDEGKKYAGYARKDAARARGWAKRLRDGWVAPSRTSTFDAVATTNPDDEIPF